MKFIQRFSVCLALVALAAPVGARAQQDAPSVPPVLVSGQEIQSDTTIRIVGFVADIENNEPVRAQLAVDGDAVVVRCNDKGRFYLRGVRPGVHVVELRAMGYEPREVEVTVPASGIAVVNLWMNRIGYIATAPTPAKKKDDRRMIASRQM